MALSAPGFSTSNPISLFSYPEGHRPKKERFVFIRFAPQSRGKGKTVWVGSTENTLLPHYRRGLIFEWPTTFTDLYSYHVLVLSWGGTQWVLNHNLVERSETPLFVVSERETLKQTSRISERRTQWGEWHNLLCALKFRAKRDTHHTVERKRDTFYERNRRIAWVKKSRTWSNGTALN